MSALKMLIGEQVSSVIFVRNYVQLGFDGPILTLVHWPHIRSDDTCLSYGMAGYRDALCALIDTYCRDVHLQYKADGTVDEDGRMHFIFDNSSLEMRLDERVAVESVIFYGRDGKIWDVW